MATSERRRLAKRRRHDALDERRLREGVLRRASGVASAVLSRELELQGLVGERRAGVAAQVVVEGERPRLLLPHPARTTCT